MMIDSVAEAVAETIIEEGAEVEDDHHSTETWWNVSSVTNLDTFSMSVQP
jgi:hypothetical protein